MHKVTFKFENSEDVTVFAAFGESLLEVARKTNVAIDAPCGGNGACGKCKVKLVGGTLDSKKTSRPWSGFLCIRRTCKIYGRIFPV